MNSRGFAGLPGDLAGEGDCGCEESMGERHGDVWVFRNAAAGDGSASAAEAISPYPADGTYLARYLRRRRRRSPWAGPEARYAGEEARGESAAGDLGKVEAAARGVWIWGILGRFGREN
jgi:hypothetical protein